ncbi:Glycosyl hydrolases family 43 [Lacunisphaera limnophila]|uniref:Glycosyl hydrolases family 43 n=1 Tax=Lacunisphaera limnophila TaxID=1838286 RepID=A0A1I7PHV8_9BACT|nr:family 43 glycosylhydrolase [Lacunisphaera limnophila]AOS43205.1 Glycosyl hydrolases family 43 [Lacunisphaera limnophila]
MPHRPLPILVCALLSLLPVAGQSAATPAASGPTRLINPLPLPNYPVGRLSRDVTKGEPLTQQGLWLVDRAEQYRELADPTGLWHEGKWYLYPSVDMAWVSADEGRTWQHHPLNLRDIGYAPTIVHHRGRFLLMSSGEIYASDSPLGPFASIGRMELPAVPGLPTHIDPMLFSDDDGRLFYYWGCTPNSGIWGVELDAADPTRVISPPKELIPFLPDTYKWERVGSHNQNPKTGWMEGAWMVKHDGQYILTYSAGGTQYRTYTMGAYRSASPLGPFVPQQRNPIFRTTEGLVTGTAHGSILRGPQGRHWVFYTVFACVVHGFERRVGLDLVEFDANGDIYVPQATVTPQALPGGGPAVAWEVLNESEPTLGSSSAVNSSGRFAADNAMTTWWLPAAADAAPQLTTYFSGRATIHAARVIWRDVGLDTKAGVQPGPFRYRIEAETAPGVWTPIIDRTASTEDFLIDYRECPPTLALRARLVITGHPAGIQPAVAEFTVFGVPER